MRTFKVIRNNDESGVSGTGHVCDGVVFDDGTTVIYWRSLTPGIELMRSFRAWYNAHVASHPTNGTEILFDDGKPMPKIYKSRRKVSNGGRVKAKAAG
jgi:hypothetical protein